MPSGDELARFPESFPQSSAPGAPSYLRVGSRFVVLGPLPDAVRSQLVHSFSDDQVHVCRGALPNPTGLPPSTLVTAAYQLAGIGADAVPTGRLFVRWTDAVPAQSRGDDLLTAGFRIDVVPPYAPHTAWVRAASGDPALALAGIEALARLRDVVHVEPEVWTERRSR